MSKIIVKDKEITITGFENDDYVSLTDIAKFLNNDDPKISYSKLDEIKRYY